MRTLFWVADYLLILLIVSSHGGEQREEARALGTLKGTNPIPEGSTLITSSRLNYLPKAHLLILSLGGWVGRVSSYEFWGGHKHLVYNIPHFSSFPFPQP